MTGKQLVRRLTAIMGVGAATVAGPVIGDDRLVETYLARYFETFPTAATAAGRHDLDDQLERLDPVSISAWVSFNRAVAAQTQNLLGDPELPRESRLDLELLQRQARLQIFDLEELGSARRNPLFWSEILANANVFLLVRDDLPRFQRLRSAAMRARGFSELTRTARQALSTTAARDLSPDLCGLADQQLRALADFYRNGFARAAPPGSELEGDLASAGAIAAGALGELTEVLSRCADTATGTFRLGEHYATRFRLVTGVEQPVGEILVEALRALEEKRTETVGYCREIWGEVFPDRAVPAADEKVIGEMFERLSRDRATTTAEFVADYRDLMARSIEFVRARDLMTLPEPLALYIDRSPSYFIGQGVGGVYPAGPYSDPADQTLLFLPTPPDDSTPATRDGFFRDFNHHFNVMITPHELIPGHYLQLELAARHPHKIRALFGDGVYVEGWGTFAERLMLDLGWGGPLARVAHLKKQLENIARTVVDIRVHTDEMSQQEVLAFVQVDAFQDRQFAINMWRRSISSAPQLTFYFLGYREVFALYAAVRASQGTSFDLKAFLDGMMEMGPVPVRHYRSAMLGE